MTIIVWSYNISILWHTIKIWHLVWCSVELPNIYIDSLWSLYNDSVLFFKFMFWETQCVCFIESRTLSKAICGQPWRLKPKRRWFPTSGAFWKQLLDVSRTTLFPNFSWPHSFCTKDLCSAWPLSVSFCELSRQSSWLECLFLEVKFTKIDAQRHMHVFPQHVSRTHLTLTSLKAKDR